MVNNKAAWIRMVISLIFIIISYHIQRKYIEHNVADGSFIVTISAIIFIYSVPVDKDLFTVGIIFALTAYASLYFAI
ncbi:hypothetical protein V6667_02950 [Neisseria leonii]|uniref:Uncharacterized protein n=1 Tax=Neisseria leonii TaxID=2995413 RepID=A0AAQ3V3P2_9NEIS